MASDHELSAVDSSASLGGTGQSYALTIYTQPARSATPEVSEERAFGGHIHPTVNLVSTLIE
jgi:hypothetical protein